MDNKPVIEKVYIVSGPREIGCGPGNMQRKTVICHVVHTRWAGVSRPETYSISCSDKLELAQRLKRAIKAGVVYTDPYVKQDAAGKPYVKHGCVVMGRTINADLNKLGF